MNKLEDILKSGSASRDEIMAEVEERAREISKRDSISKELAFAKAVRENPEAYTAYCSARPAPPKIEKSDPVRITKSEQDLDLLARRIMKRDGLSYPAAIQRGLLAQPELYDRYCAERAAGQYVVVKQSQDSDEDPMDEMDECPNANCDNEDLPPNAKFCPDCGMDLTKAKAALKAKTASKR